MLASIKNLKRTPLDERPFQIVAEVYSEDIVCPIRIIFDNRIKDYGTHEFKDREHIIRISPKTNKEVYSIFSTLLHEIQHARQIEQKGKRFYNKKADFNSSKDEGVSEYYSPSEVEARVYENLHVLDAVSLYFNEKKALTRKR